MADDFNPEVGFLSRRGCRKPDYSVLRRIRPESLWGLHEVRPHVSYRGYWSFDGFQETGFLHVDNHWEWKNGYERQQAPAPTRRDRAGSGVRPPPL